MIPTEKALADFSGSSPIYAMSDFVLFPKTGQSIELNKPNEMLMVDDVLQGERLLTIALINKSTNTVETEFPPIYHIGTLGYIFNHEVLKNGAYKIVFVGLKKVQINESIQEHPYRTGALTILEEITHFADEKAKRIKLLNKFRMLLNISSSRASLELFENSIIDIEMLTNIICSVFPTEKTEQQKLLELPDVSLRLDVLCQFMDNEIEAIQPDREFNFTLPNPNEWN